MNCTALVTPPDTKTDTQNIGVPRPSGGWPLSDRWAWSYSLPVSGIARAVAGCIAYHANAKTGLSWPGMGTIAKETGFGRTAIVAAIKVLERGGHVSVTRLKIGKKNTSNRYRLPPMGNVSASHPSAPDGLGPSAPDGPELVRTELVSTKAGVHTALPADTLASCSDLDCYQCLKAKVAPRRPGRGQLAISSLTACFAR